MRDRSSVVRSSTLGGPMPARTNVRRYRVRPNSVAIARHHVGALLHRWRLGPLAYDAILITSELTTNVVEHTADAGEFFEVGLRSRQGLVILEVSDSLPCPLPRITAADADDTSGRGLFIVQMLATNWGVRPWHRTGKTVWAHLPHQRAELLC